MDGFYKWEHKVEEFGGLRMWIPAFKTCGMRRMYSRADTCSRNPRKNYNLEVWEARDGRLFAKMWITKQRITNEYHQVQGYHYPHFPKQDERWAPQVLRDHYIGWAMAMRGLVPETGS
jgi:hypothetical protein